MKLLSPRDAAQILGVSTSRVQQLDREGRLRAVRDSSGRRLFREGAVRRFLEARKAGARHSSAGNTQS